MACPVPTRARRGAWGAMRAGPSAFAMICLSGCTGTPAPAMVLFGAYFPDWLVFACIAIAVAVVARIAAGIAGKAGAVPFPLFTFLSIGVLAAGLLDLIRSGW